MSSDGEPFEPTLWFALSVAGITYAVGLAGIWSIYQTLNAL